MMERIDDRSYQYIANYHGWINQWCKHQTEFDDLGRVVHLFLPWHRAYMLKYERLLQIAINDDTLALPWWNWRSTGDIPSAYSTPTVGADRQPNSLFKFHMKFSGRVQGEDGNPRNVNVDKDTERSVGASLSMEELKQIVVGNIADVPDLYAKNDFREFSERLRNNWHNGIHNYVGGEMSDPNLAAYDPLFYPHHCNIDRIWAIWQVQHGVDNMPSHIKDVILIPFGIPVRQVLDINALQYEYASSLSS